MSFNFSRPVNSQDRVFVNNEPLDEVFDFKYLGSQTSSSAKDIHVRKGLAWKALQSLDMFWKSSMSRTTKTRIFRMAVEPILLYGCETWTLKESLVKELDGFYTRMLRKVFNIHWKSHTTNIELYGTIPKLSNTIKQRRLRFAGHLHRHNNQPVHHLLLWQPGYGKRYQGRPRLTYPEVIYKDTGMDKDAVQKAMLDRDGWRQVVDNSFQDPGST